MNRLRPGGERQTPTSTQAASTVDEEIQVATDRTASRNEAGTGLHELTLEDKDHNDAVPNREAQLGVQKIEAVTLAWTKRWLAALLIKYVPACMRTDIRREANSRPYLQYLGHFPHKRPQTLDPRELDAIRHK